MMVEMNGDLKWKADEAIDEAYRRGYEDGKKNHEKVRNDDMGYGYQRGLEDAWECVLKIGKLDVEKQKSIFGTYTTRQIALAFTVQQAMQKIKDYEVRCNSRKGNCVECAEQFICEEPCEEKQKQNNNTLTLYEKWKKYIYEDDEIKVLDEVKVYDDCIGIVTRHAQQARTCYVMYRDGSCGEEELTDCKKTGNHSMSLDKWLEQMRKESHEV